MRAIIRLALLAGMLLSNTLLQAAPLNGNVNWQGWQFNYSVGEKYDALALKNVRFQGTAILGRISLPVMNVFYERDVCGPYADRISQHNNLPVDWEDIDSDGNVVLREFQFQGKTWLEIGIRAMIGSYDIYQNYYLNAEGILDAHIFARGLQCNNFHEHYPIWRLDFDLAGPENDRILYRTDAGMQPMRNEFTVAASSAVAHDWVVEDTLTGDTVSIAFDNNRYNMVGEVSPEEAYTNNIVAGRRLRSGEARWQGAASHTMPHENGENIDGRDIYLMYRGYMPHSAAEGQTLWHSTGVRLTIDHSIQLSVLSPGTQTGQTDVPVSLPLEIYADSATSYRVSATGLPPGLSVDASTGAISGSPTTPGRYTVSVRVIDNSGEQAPATVDFSWNVSVTGELDCQVHSARDLPKYLPNRSGSADGEARSAIDIADDIQIHDLKVRGIKGDHSYVGDLSFNLFSPQGTQIALWKNECGNNDNFDISLSDDASGTISCPLSRGRTQRPVGTLSSLFESSARGRWELQVLDRSSSDDGTLREWALEVCTLDVSDPRPVINAIAAQQHRQGDPVSLQVSATGSSTLSYSASNLPSGLSIDRRSGLISGTANTAFSGATRVTVSDGRYSAHQSFSWVVNTNSPPTLQELGSQSGAVGDRVSIRVRGNDADGDSLTFSASNLPSGLSINSGGRIRGTLSSAGRFQSTISVSDGRQSTEQSIVWVVSEANRPPNLSTPPSQNLVKGTPATLAIDATDPEGDALTYSASNLPDGLSINSGSGLIRGTPTRAQVKNSVISVSDGTSPVSVNVTWTVDEPATSTETPLDPGVPARGDAARGEWTMYTVTAGEEHIALQVDLSGLVDDVDLYVRAGQPPSGHVDQAGIYDCGSTFGGRSSESCNLRNNGETVWYIGVYGYSSSRYTLEASLIEADDTGTTALAPGERVDAKVQTGTWRYYTIDAGAEHSALKVSLTGLDADADLYVRQSLPPSDHVDQNGVYDCGSYRGGTSNERCTVDNTGASTWHIGVYGYRGTDYTLEAMLQARGDSSDDIALTLNEIAEGSIAPGQWRYYALDVDDGVDSVHVTLSGMSADGDLYVRHNARPSGTADEGGEFDCHSVAGSDTIESCRIDDTAGKRYIIAVLGYAQTDYKLQALPRATADDAVSINSGELHSGSVSLQQWRYYQVSLGASDLRLLVDLTDLSADADLFVREGQIPDGDPGTGANADCYSDRGNTQVESCVVDNNGASTWYIGVYGYSGADYALRVRASSSRMALSKLQSPRKGERSDKYADTTPSSPDAEVVTGGGSLSPLWFLLLVAGAWRPRQRG